MRFAIRVCSKGLAELVSFDINSMTMLRQKVVISRRLWIAVSLIAAVFLSNVVILPKGSETLIDCWVIAALVGWLIAAIIGSCAVFFRKRT